MINYNTYNPVRAISFKGKLLTRLVRFGFRVRSIFGKKYVYPLKGHHEDPLKMSTNERLYLGYKYYYKAIVEAEENSGIAGQFKLPLQPKIPDGFIPETTITMSAGGDLMPYTCINKVTCSHLWDEVGEFFFSSDIVFANLETPIDNTKKPSAVPEVMLSNMYFNGSSELFDVFSAFGKYGVYDILSVANNHSLDQQSDGLLATLDFLTEKGIAFTGAVKTREDYNHFPILERDGIKIAFLAWTFSLNMETVPTETPWLCNHICLNEPNPDISPIIHQAKLAHERGADLVAAALHMGCAYQPFPDQQIIDTMQRICREAGVDLILGGHPHNPQPLSFYNYHDQITGEEKQSLIIYSLGDFVAYDIFKWCHAPLIAKLNISKGSMNGKSLTCITGIQLKTLYLDATVEKGIVTQLHFRDVKRLRHKVESALLSPDSQKELTEIIDFLDEFVLPSNSNEIVV
ncbi:MAG: CapA family protein [Flavobacteriia bacterium]|nr:CapA family protein [Flavobacteriia bacterium]